MLVLKKNNIPNLVKRFKELHKKKFEVGYWQSQGFHNSGLTYPNLFAILSYGSDTAHIPPRPILNDTFSMWAPLNKNMLLKNQLKLYFSNIKSKTPKITATILMEKVAGKYVQDTRDGFADLSKLTANAPFTQYLKQLDNRVGNAPLVWTGELQANLSYSLNGETVVTP